VCKRIQSKKGGDNAREAVKTTTHKNTKYLHREKSAKKHPHTHTTPASSQQIVPHTQNGERGRSEEKNNSNRGALLTSPKLPPSTKSPKLSEHPKLQIGKSPE